MTKVITVTLENDDMDILGNVNRRASINWRYRYFRRVMERSSIYWDIREEEADFDDNGNYVGVMFIFYINEFYTGVVLDMLKYDGFNSDAEWADWFCNKYKVDRAA